MEKIGQLGCTCPSVLSVPVPVCRALLENAANSLELGYFREQVVVLTSHVLSHAASTAVTDLTACALAHLFLEANPSAPR